MDTKKIGIITIVKTNNYGAELQAYALQKALNNLGFDAEIIDYLFYKHKDFKRSKASTPWVNIGFWKKMKEFLYPINYTLKIIPYRKIQKQREKKFEAFHYQYTRFSSYTFFSINQLYESQHSYDVFMVGSDQVWNPYSNISLDPYFLTFAPKGKRKISYASSFGISEVSTQIAPFYSDRLKQLHAISVRELQGVDLVEKLTGIKPTHVLDPTLLLSKMDWETISKKPINRESYILLYTLTPSDYAFKLAESLSQQTGWKIIRLCKEAVREDKNQAIENIIDAGPDEFLGWFIDASLIITNSFHGTAFSINFNRPFYTILPAHKKNNSRQESLLYLLKLENRMLSEGSIYPEMNNIELNFSISNQLLENEKKKSINYLINAIS